MVREQAGEGAALARVSVRAAQVGDGQALAPLLRLSDRREMFACGPGNLADRLERIIQCGELTYLAHLGDTPVTLFGRSRSSYSNLLARAYAKVWMVGSDEIAKRPRELLRLTRQMLPQVLGGSIGWNYMDSRNDLHVRFLRRLGARIYDHEQTTLFDPNVPFWRFELESRSCV